MPVSYTHLEFDDDALYAIAKMAKEKKVGARALRAIIEDFMLDIMYEIPKDDNIGTVTITKDYVCLLYTSRLSLIRIRSIILRLL